MNFPIEIKRIPPRICSKVISCFIALAITMSIYGIHNIKSFDTNKTPKDKSGENESIDKTNENDNTGSDKNNFSLLNEKDAATISGLITARSGLIYSEKTMQIIASKASRETMSVGDLTVFAVAILVVNAVNNGEISWDDTAICPASAAKRSNYSSSSTVLTVGKKMTISELLHCMIFQSGSAFAYTLAVHISGSEEAFVQRLNHQLLDTGIENTVFTNVCGEDDETSKTTAFDIANIINRFLSIPILREIFTLQNSITVTKTEGDSTWSAVVNNEFFSKHTTLGQSKADGVLGGKIGTCNGSKWSAILFSSNEGDFLVLTINTTVPYSDALQISVAFKP